MSFDCQTKVDSRLEAVASDQCRRGGNSPPEYRTRRGQGVGGRARDVPQACLPRLCEKYYRQLHMLKLAFWNASEVLNRYVPSGNGDDDGDVDMRSL